MEFESIRATVPTCLVFVTRNIVVAPPEEVAQDINHLGVIDTSL